MPKNVLLSTLCISLILLLGFFNLNSQSLTSADLQQQLVLDEYFNNYQIVEYDMSLDKVKKIKNDGFSQFTWPTNDGNIRFESHVKDIHKQQYELRSADTDTNVNRIDKVAPVVLRGHSNGYQQNLSITINENFIYGTVETDEGIFFIEPLQSYIESAPSNLYLSYRAEDAKLQNLPNYCAAVQKQQKESELSIDASDASRQVGGCFEVEIALAGDFLMFQKYGSVFGVENQITGVLNNVQTNYDDEFDDEILFFVSETFVSNCNTCDPWTNSTDAGTLLNSFRSWGPSGFNFNHDVATLWTNRNFDGGTIGIAFVGVICTGSRYNCCQDFSNNANLLRVVWAHELGHNFDALHDASGNGTIMAPSVNSSTSWSSASITDIQNHYLSRTCLADCSVAIAPVSNFDFTLFGDCIPTEVQYTSTSTAAASFAWSFPGGTPSTSTDANPFVTYTTAGSFDATLTVSNGVGSDTETKFNIVNVGDLPTAFFDYSVNGLDVSFIDLSTGSNLGYFWSFGNGSTSSQQQPSVSYAQDGLYTVTLEIVNDCGTDLFTDIIEIITPPVAAFSAADQSACVGEFINFTNESSVNADTYDWIFEGGNPAVSTLETPIVQYDNPGLFDVQLTASNSGFDNVVTEEDFVLILDNPIAGFDYTVDGLTVTFTNTSTSADAFNWSFGDGALTTITNPTHEYPDVGTYTVVLEADNAECDINVITVEISVSSLPQPAFSSNVASGCLPISVTFDDQSTNDPTSWNWTFEGGTPSSSTLENPVVEYMQSGEYDVTLQVGNDEGVTTITTQEYITVIDAPTADFAVTGNGTFVSFSNTSIGATSYVWDFGDGTTSTEVDPTHEYTNEGIYVATLTATNECGDSETTTSVNLYTQPQAAFDNTATTICAGETVTFDNQSSDNVDTYSWTFEGGTPSTSTEANPTITYDVPGNYSVELTVSNPSFSDMITEDNLVVVLDIPTAISIPTYTESGLTVQFDDNIIDGDTYMWDFGDGNSSTDDNPSHSYAAEGSYTVIVSVSNACGSTSSTVLVDLYTAPTAAFSSSISGGCAPVEITFTNESSDNATSFMWLFDGGTPATSTEMSPTVTYAQAGTYDVTLVAMNPLFDNTVIQDELIIVNDVPTGDFAFDSNDLLVDFSVDSDNTTSFAWDFGDGNMSTDANPTHTYAAEGEYAVSLSLTNECGTTKIENAIEVSFAVLAAFTAENTTGCSPLEVRYMNASTANASSFSWSFPGGSPSTSTEEDVLVIYDTPGVYSASLSVTSLNDMNSTTQTDIITVLSKPEVSFDTNITGSIVSLQNTSIGATSYEWDFGDGTKSTDENPEHTYTSSGVYTLTLTATNECGFTTITKDINIIISNVDDISSISGLMVYPNPSNGVFQLDLTSSSKSTLSVNILDLTGRVVYNSIEQLGANNKFTKNFDLPNLTQATYLLVLRTDEGQIIRKINIIE